MTSLYSANQKSIHFPVNRRRMMLILSPLVGKVANANNYVYHVAIL